MLVYHGSTKEIQKPGLNYGRFNLDFGNGFYVTTIPEQAEKWARRRAMMEVKKPFVNLYNFNIDQLNILTFGGYTEKWLDFIVKNRAGAIELHQYDAIYGNIANDDVATMVNDYMRLLKKGRITPGGKQFFLEQLQYSKPNNQYCITSQKGINALQFTDCYFPEN